MERKSLVETKSNRLCWLSGVWEGGENRMRKTLLRSRRPVHRRRRWTSVSSASAAVSAVPSHTANTHERGQSVMVALCWKHQLLVTNELVSRIWAQAWT